MDMEIIVTSITILAIIIALSVFIYWNYRNQRKKQNRLAAELGYDRLEWGKTYSGRLQDREYFYEYYPGSKNRPSSFTISIDSENRGEFRVHKERKFDRLFKFLGITVEIQTGDRYFDENYYLETDSVAFSRTCFDSADAREAVNRLFSQGITRLSCNRENLQAVISPFRFGENIDREFVESVVTELIRLRDCIPRDFFEPVIAGTPAWKVKRNTVYAVSVASLAVGGLLLVIGLKFYRPLDGTVVFLFSLRYSIPVLVLFAVFAVIWLKGRSSSHRELAVNSLIALFGIPLAGVALVIVLNGYLDKSATSMHEMLVAGKKVTHSSKSTSYYIRVKSWRKGRQSEKIKVSKQLYRQVRTGKTVVSIETGPGYLQFEWLVSLKVKQPK